MTRILNFILAGLLIAAAIGVYSIKYEATLQAEKVAKLQRAIDQEHTAIAALKAEWAFLVQPDRLTSLAGRHLDLKPMKMTQVVKLSETATHHLWIIERCPVCWQRHSEEPCCQLAGGLLEEAIYWGTGGRRFKVEEIECIAAGHPTCLFHIDKHPTDM